MSKRVNNKKGRIRKAVKHPTKLRGGTQMSGNAYNDWRWQLHMQRIREDIAARKTWSKEKRKYYGS